MPVTIIRSAAHKGDVCRKPLGELWRHSSLAAMVARLQHIHGHRLRRARAAALDHFLNLFGLSIAREQCGKRPRLAFVAHKQTQAVGIATRIRKSPGPHYAACKPSHAYLIAHVKPHSLVPRNVVRLREQIGATIAWTRIRFSRDVHARPGNGGRKRVKRSAVVVVVVANRDA